MTRSFVLSGEGNASLLELQGDKIRVSASRPSPPGSLLVLSSDDAPAPIKIKVRACRKEEASDAYVIEGRLVDATRALLDALG